MKESTRNEYLSLANHFIKTVNEKYDNKKIPPRVYIDELNARAENTTPAYWRRLRNALNLYALENLNGKYKYAYKHLKNPMTTNKIKTDGMKKRNKIKKISNKDLIKLLENTKNKNLKSVITIIKITGCRPSEIKNITVEDGRVFIPSAKKNAAGTRGHDRYIRLSKKSEALLISSLGVLQTHAKKNDLDLAKIISNAQDNFRRLSLRVFPRRKNYCLYTIRHQFGSDLKASGLSRQECAYIMGHRSTSSLDQYGDKRSGRGGGVAVRADESFRLVREDHRVVDANMRKTMTHASKNGAVRLDKTIGLDR